MGHTSRVTLTGESIIPLGKSKYKTDMLLIYSCSPTHLYGNDLIIGARVLIASFRGSELE